MTEIDNKEGIVGVLIKHKRGIRTYKFAERFIETSGINATLHTGADACVNDKHPGIVFYLNNNNNNNLHKGNLSFLVRGKYAQIGYNRELAKSDLDMLNKADLQSTLRTIANGAGYDFKIDSIWGHSIKSIGIHSEVPTNDYETFATFVGGIDQMISLYLKGKETNK